MCKIKTESLVFRNEADVITVVTDGNKTAMYGPKGRKFFPSLLSAVAVAESHGFHLCPDEGWS